MDSGASNSWHQFMSGGYTIRDGKLVMGRDLVADVIRNNAVFTKGPLIFAHPTTVSEPPVASKSTAATTDEAYPSLSSTSSSASASATPSPSASPLLSSKVLLFIPPHVLARRPSIPGPVTRMFAAQRDPESRNGGSDAASLVMPSTSAFSERERIHVLASDPDAVVAEDNTGVGSVAVSSVSMTTTFITDKLCAVCSIPHRCASVVRDLVGGLGLGRASPPLPSTASTPPIASVNPTAKIASPNDAEPLVVSPNPVLKFRASLVAPLPADLSHTFSERERIQVLASDPDVGAVEDAGVALVAGSAVSMTMTITDFITDKVYAVISIPLRCASLARGLVIGLGLARTAPSVPSTVTTPPRASVKSKRKDTRSDGAEPLVASPTPILEFRASFFAPPPADLSQVGSSSYRELFGVPGVEEEPYGAGASGSGEKDRPLTSGSNVEEGGAADAVKAQPLSDAEFYASLPRPAATIFRRVDGAWEWTVGASAYAVRMGGWGVNIATLGAAGKVFGLLRRGGGGTDADGAQVEVVSSSSLQLAISGAEEEVEEEEILSAFEQILMRERKGKGPDPDYGRPEVESDVDWPDPD
ncbi:hypothetical protein BDK51DRAFT_39589 [Blyttiomyces helicus]|uniref:Uncharacterized protein n=1 Tax=Blyttiomyces helicus TaxID=388810 RepID=A0A4P9WAG4_9FUNG|nr:hypothetical protein BDK51DRAFT_39589 [Blyttiomyces helicus]|eukprot:RKO88545.1 hypothetical protein BDK51DRAFT_39589 [Blyttiomyces helicus]